MAAKAGKLTAYEVLEDQLAMTWGEGSAAVGREAPALARESVCSFSGIPA